MCSLYHHFTGRIQITDTVITEYFKCSCFYYLIINAMSIFFTHILNFIGGRVYSCAFSLASQIKIRHFFTAVIGRPGSHHMVFTVGAVGAISLSRGSDGIDLCLLYLSSRWILLPIPPEAHCYKQHTKSILKIKNETDQGHSFNSKICCKFCHSKIFHRLRTLTRQAWY